MDEFEILFYEKEDGTEPAKDFLLSLDKKMRTKMLRTIEMLQYNGYELREPYSKSVSEGIMELRAKVGSAILTNGFIKKTQKTPKEEIERAKRYRADYLSREENNND